MRQFKCFPLALALGLVAGSALAEDWHGPLLNQEVGIAVPEGFGAAPSFSDSNVESAIVEFQLPDETQDVWTQMVTLTGYADPSGQAAEAAANAMAANLAQGYAAACPNSFNAQDLGAPALPGAEAVLVGWLSCGDTGGGVTAESMVVLIAVKAGTIFTVQWAERGPASATPLPYDASHWLPRLDVLMTFSL